jgi:hypothetical protein
MKNVPYSAGYPALTQEQIEMAYFENDGAPKFSPDGDRFIAATGEMEGYEEWFACWLERAGKIYEVESSHCSCNGFEWSPVEVTREYLAHVAEYKGCGAAEQIRAYLRNEGGR